VADLEEVFGDFERWHDEHPWRSRWCRLKGMTKDVWHWRHIPRWKYQRAKRGYSTCDWWSFDTYICGVIASACRDFRDHGIGHPSDVTEEEWDDTLTRIAEPLQAYSDGKFEVFTAEEMAAQYEAAREAMHLFAENLGSMWD
jgi:hypothetical protein